ncbi:uncharacterized protein LOC110112581 [Dendrobium catenatum]|uniref:Uncharacterized protein n=1 Tax=Dendrobium catenatum TaxID=906689 RepID=A0A2I0WZR8_9ASPA|nr:uncharacterized protein LOC110112581 [Dendrobium catenatum]PKU81155.1 hypothetical protein MA16_Dca014038 [Dendrobium catenatum]
MKGRAGISATNTGGIPTDLLVCFPSRAHLTLMPKPICSPSRPAHHTKRYLSRPIHRSQSSPLFRSKTGKYSGAGAAAEEITDEPTSPTVTCAGQIKVRPRSRPGPKPSTSSSRDGKGWLSVMEEVEKLQSKKPLMQFLGALRSLKFDLHCFGSFHGAVDCSTDEEEGAEAEEEVEEDKDLEGSTSRTIFSKWFMLLEENQNHELKKEMKKEDDRKEREEEELELAPPSNALLLMRCRSAPAEGRAVTGKAEKDLVSETPKEDNKEKKERLLLMSYDPDFTKLSTEISKETWIVGNFDPLNRSRSWKR